MLASGKVKHPSEKKVLNLILFTVSFLIGVLIVKGSDVLSPAKSASTLVLVAICFLLLYLFLLHFRSEILEVSRKVFFILALILLFLLAARLVLFNPSRDLIFIVPFALIPVLVRTFYDSRLALFILLITLILASFMISDPFRFIIINILAGVVAILSLSDINRKFRLAFSSLVVTLTYLIIYTAFELREHESFGNIDISTFRWFAGNGFLILAGYPVITLFERKFYFLSDISLLELSHSGSPLLRRLSEEAPGSYQHSLQVANLAEAAAREIGANVLLTRAGSLYHDIGKIISPMYFIENQNPEKSPHVNLDPAESSRMIISHVENGVKLAKEYKLPVQIIDFIKTHHGTSKAYYFYRMYLDRGALPESAEDDFKYRGPRPFSRETAIVMMADAVEAASRTIEKYTDESISELVERIIIFQEHEDQFSDAPLTFRDIAEIKEVFKKRLLNIYHSRIAYPG